MNTIKEFTHPHLGIRMDVKNVVLSTLLLALGIVLVIYSLKNNSSAGESNVILLGIGACSFVAALVCYFVYGKALYFLPTIAKVEFLLGTLNPNASLC